MLFHPILADGFDLYTVGQQRWTLGSGITCSPSFSRHSWGQGASNTGFSGVGFPWIEIPQVASLIWEGAKNLQEFNTNDPIALGVGKLGVSSGNHIDIRLSTSKHPYIVHSQSGALLLGPTVGPEHVIEAGNWYWWQLHVIPHESAGYVKFAINGKTWLEGSGLNTKHPSFDALIDSFNLAHGAFNSWRYDDFVWQDGSDGAFQGAGMAVIGKRPIAAGAFDDFSVSGAATAHEALDEITRDDDATHIASSTLGHRTSSIIDNITEVPETSTVLAVQNAFAHRKTEPGPRSVTSFVRVDTDEVLGEERYPSETSYLTNIESPQVLQPDGVSAWGTVGEFNDLDVEIGQEVGSGVEDES